MSGGSVRRKLHQMGTMQQQRTATVTLVSSFHSESSNGNSSGSGTGSAVVAHGSTNDTTPQEQDDGQGSNAAIAIWLGLAIDALPESVVIGLLCLDPDGVSIAFIAGVFLANLPEVREHDYHALWEGFDPQPKTDRFSYSENDAITSL